MADPPPGPDLTHDVPQPGRRRATQTGGSGAPGGRRGWNAHPELPLDPDPARTGSAATCRGAHPVHRQPRMMLLVLAGAALGTPARYALSVMLPTRTGSWPVGTLTANLLGAFLLGVLLEGLARRGRDTGYRRLLRLTLGTGFLGAFTTYSTLAVETDLLVRAHRPGLAAAYAGASLFAGLLATTAGIWLAAAHHRRRQGPTAPAGPGATVGSSDPADGRERPA